MTKEANSNINTEKERIKILKDYDILDTPPDGSFDRITKMASHLLKVPIAIVSLVDTDRIWFKSRYGLDINETTRDPGLCASAILSEDLYLVEDAINDPRSLANPLVAGEFGLRFYAAAPLKVKEGYNLGTLCVIDKNPRELTEEEKDVLQNLAALVIDQLELRLAARRAIYDKNQVLNITVHDLKNPLSTILLWADSIEDAKEDEKVLQEISKNITKTTKKMNRIINELLESASTEANKVSLRLTKIDFANLVTQVVETNKVSAKYKGQKLNLFSEAHPFVNGDEDKLTEVANNLINNAIKYSASNKSIDITIKSKNNAAILEVKDQGPGLTPADKQKLFQRFTRLSAQPTGGEKATGLGLSIVKLFVEAHKGKIWAESEGTNKGSKFVVEIPSLQ